MDFKHLETFLRVVSTGGYTRAAVSLGVSQPTVSARVSALEAELGEALFEREGNAMVLSSAGMRLVPFAEELVQVTEQARHAVAASTGSSPSTVIRIGANTTTASGPLPGWLSRFHRLTEGRTRTDVHVNATPGLMQALHAGTVQVAFVNPRLAHHQSTVLWTKEYPIHLYARADHPLAGRSIMLDELAKETFVSLELGPAANQIRAISSLLGTEVQVITRTNSTEVVKSLILGGHAIGLLPEPAAQVDVATGHLAIIDIEDYAPDPWDISLVRWSDRSLTSVVSRFVDFVIRTEAEQPAAGLRDAGPTGA